MWFQATREATIRRSYTYEFEADSWDEAEELMDNWDVDHDDYDDWDEDCDDDYDMQCSACAQPRFCCDCADAEHIERDSEFFSEIGL